MQNKLYIGPAGWSYKDWEGIVYPAKKDKQFNHLKYLVQYFNTIEINSSFYRPPNAQTTHKWIDISNENPDFLFTYKLWQEFTHNPQSPVSNDKEKYVKNGLDPLVNNDKLGALLIQFPWSFKFSKSSMERLEKIVSKFIDYNPVIEVRHSSWNTNEFYNFMHTKKIGFANIDQPVIGDSLEMTNKTTSHISYLRLHGRNYENWFKQDANAVSRYDYLYHENELREIASVIESLIENSSKTFIIFNNHYRGQAIANALEAMFITQNQPVAIPGSMFETYPSLKNIAVNKSPKGQISLF